jgi:glutaminyl-peptide cyclotransferase
MLTVGLAACSRTPSADVGAATASPGPTDAPAAPGHAPTPAVDRPATYRVEVLGTYPHDETSWTEGLEVYQGLLLESAGRVGQSSLRLADPRTGELRHLVAVDDELYAEGVTVVDGRAIQLTWQDQALITTALPDLDPASVNVRVGAYEGEGWGLCYDGTDLVMSDGSDQLQFRDPATFELRRRLPVTLDGAPMEEINELECVDGEVWANVWLSTTVVVIDPTTGEVTGTADLADLVPEQFRDSVDAVANGIAHDPATGSFWVTGKLWPVSYEVTFAPA